MIPQEENQRLYGWGKSNPSSVQREKSQLQKQLVLWKLFYTISKSCSSQLFKMNLRCTFQVLHFILNGIKITFYSKWYQDNNNKYLDSTYCLPGCTLDALQVFID